MAGLRQPRPGPPRGGKHKDISPLLGAIGGTGTAAAGAGESGLRTDTGDAINTPSGDASSSIGQSGAQAGTVTPPSNSPNFSSLLTKPNFWQNLITKGGAQMGYNSNLASLASQQLAGANQQAGIHATGEESRTTATAQESLDKDRAMTDQALKIAALHGVPITSADDLEDFKSSISNAATSLAQKKLQGASIDQDTTNTALQDPSILPNAIKGLAAEKSAPFAHNAALGTKLEPGQNYMGFPTATQPMTGSGSIPGGSSITTGYAKDPTTGMPSTTVTTKPLAPRSGGFQLNLGQNGGANLSDLANQMASSQPTGTQEGENDESYNPLPDASSTLAISTKPSMLQSLLQTLNTPTSNSTNPFGNGNPTGALPPNPMAFSGGSGATTPPLQQLIQLLTKPTTNSSNPFSR